MDFRALRNDMEAMAAAFGREGDGTPAAAALQNGILAFGQSIVGIYEELHGIRRALEHVPTHEEHPS